jgi:hypothetical protein
MLGLQNSLLTNRLPGRGLLYRHRLREDLFGKALEEPCSRSLPHLGTEEELKTQQPHTIALLFMNQWLFLSPWAP